MFITKYLSKINKVILFSSLWMCSSFASATNSFNISLTGTSSFSTGQQTAFTQAEVFWENIITGYQPGYKKLSFFADLPGITINTGSLTSDGVGGVLGSADPISTTSLDFYNYTYAISGSMNFDPADLSNMESNGSLLSIVKHEMAHALGFGSLWESNSLYVADSGQYTGAGALSAYQTEFDPLATFVPVELQGGVGTANGHWNEGNGTALTGITDSNGRDMRDELMTGLFLNNGKTFLSNTTIASFKDLGYTVAFPVAVVPVPAAIWLFISALGFLGFTSKKTQL